SATPRSTAFFSISIVQDFQDSLDDEYDTRSSHEYLNDLEEEYWKRISEKRTKNQSQQTKPSTEWKNMEKTKSNRSQVNKSQSQSQPRGVSVEKTTKTDLKSQNCQKWAHLYPPSEPR
ncbi:hypothetical protein Tco_0346017, partial [Tanacetum coccineum]